MDRETALGLEVAIIGGVLVMLIGAKLLKPRSRGLLRLSLSVGVFGIAVLFATGYAMPAPGASPTPTSAPTCPLDPAVDQVVWRNNVTLLGSAEDLSVPVGACETLLAIGPEWSLGNGASCGPDAGEVCVLAWRVEHGVMPAVLASAPSGTWIGISNGSIATTITTHEEEVIGTNSACDNKSCRIVYVIYLDGQDLGWPLTLGAGR